MLVQTANHGSWDCGTLDTFARKSAHTSPKDLVNSWAATNESFGAQRAKAAKEAEAGPAEGVPSDEDLEQATEEILAEQADLREFNLAGLLEALGECLMQTLAREHIASMPSMVSSGSRCRPAACVLCLAS